MPQPFCGEATYLDSSGWGWRVDRVAGTSGCQPRQEGGRREAYVLSQGGLQGSRVCVSRRRLYLGLDPPDPTWRRSAMARAMGLAAVMTFILTAGGEARAQYGYPAG